MNSPTLNSACEAFLYNIQKKNTLKNYRSDLLGETGLIYSLAPAIKPTSPITVFTEGEGVLFIQNLVHAGSSPSTIKRRLSVMRKFIRFISDEYDLPISVDKLMQKLENRYLIPKNNVVVSYPGAKIQRILDYTKRIDPADLRMRRDMAFIWSLAETGLRVSEACNLKIGQINKEWRAAFIGKGDISRSVKFGKHSRTLLKSYLKARQVVDGSQRDMLPLFIRHDKAVGRTIKPITPKIGEQIVHNFALLALGEEYDPTITCHKFRHYYISTIARDSGMQSAQVGAGHKDISTTQRYTHMEEEEIASINDKSFG
jgi:integrase/recombinase XerC